MLVVVYLCDRLLTFSLCSHLDLPRIMAMRVAFRERLEAGMAARGVPAEKCSWKHVTDQIGMFCYTGLTVEQVRAFVGACCGCSPCVKGVKGVTFALFAKCWDTASFRRG